MYTLTHFLNRRVKWVEYLNPNSSAISLMDKDVSARRQNAESVKMVEESVISIAAIILKASNFALLKNVSNKKG